MSKGGGGNNGMVYGLPSIQSNNSSSSGSNNIPSWLEGASKQGVGTAQDLLNQGTQAYQGGLVSNLTNDQQAAGSLIRNQLGAYSPYYDQARQALGMGMNQITPQTMQQGLQNIGSYMNPYVNNVISASEAVGQRTLGNNLNQIRDSALRSGAAYGSRHGVQEGAAAADNAINQQNFAANALNQAYGQAAGYLGGDITNNLQAQQQNAANAQNVGNSLSSLATNQRAANTADVSNLLNFGTADQENQTAQNQANYQEWLRVQNQPWQNLQNYTNVLATTPKSTTHTGNTNSQSIGYQPQQQTSSSPLMGLAGGALTGAQMGSSFGPWGTAIGAAGGGLLGAFSGRAIR